MADLKGQLFARLALDYFDHPKIGALSPAAICAHLEMIVYSRRYLTDGRIPSRVANRFGSDSLSELASNDPERPSITIHDDGSLTVHDYAEYQETKDQVEARRQVNARNGKRGGRPPKSRETHPVTEPGAQSRTESEPSRKAETETETETTHSPTESEGTRKRARTLPQDWQPTDRHRQIAHERGIDCDLEAEKFRDWCGATGKTYKDHDLAFNGWIRRARPDTNTQRSKTSTRLDGGMRLVDRYAQEEAWNAQKQLGS